MSNTGFRFGDWDVDLEGNAVSDGSVRTQLEPRVMQVLRYLCRHPGAVIPAEELLQACWGSNELGDNPVHKAITQLRRALGDSTTDPRYIETIRKRGYRAIATVVEAAEAAPAGWTSGSPFRGLEAFQENHAAIFFGRVSATAQLRAIVTAQAVEGCAMALVLGPSGSGKTSLVRAGLLPQLMAGAARPDEAIVLSSTTYLDCADLGGGNLFQALAAALLDADLDDAPLFDGDSAASLGLRLEKDAAAVASFVGERTGGKPRIAIFVDRLEAIFRSSAADRTAFIAVLETLALGKGLLVVTACRNDFYPDIVALPALMALKARGGHYDLTAPDGADIAQIVRQPARAAQLTFEQDAASGASLDDVLCDAARGSPDTLPLLQYCLNELYRLRSEDGQLRFEAFHQLGGIEGAIGVRAEQVVDGLKPEQVAALPHVLSLLVNIGDEQAAVTARRSPWSLLRSDAERELVRAMVEARLFVSELAGDVPSFGVAHEALLRRWPRVVEWIERYRHALQLRTRLSGQAARWATSGRKHDLLIPRGIQVNQASELLTLADFSLAPLEEEYVRGSIRRAQFAQRIMLGATILIGLLAVLTTISALNARSAEHEAERNRVEAEGLMTFMLGDFAEKLRPIGRLDLLDDVGNKALIYLGKSDVSNTSAASMTSRVKALRIIGETEGNKGRSEQYHKTMLTARDLIRNSPQDFMQQAEFLKEAGAIAFHLGQYHAKRRELDEAESYYNEYHDYSNRFASVTPNPAEGWLEQSYANNALGVLAMDRADYASASKQFTQSLELKRRAASQRKPDAKMTMELATTVAWYAESTLKSGNPSAAMDLYKQEEALLRSIQASDTGSQSKLALSLMRQALLSVALGQRNEAALALQEAVQISETLASKDPQNSTWQARLLQAQGRLAEVQLQPENARQILSRLQAIYEKVAALSASEPGNTFLTYLSVRFELARTNALMALGHTREAIANTDTTLAKLDELHAKTPKDKALLPFLSDGLLVRAELTRKFDGDAEAKPYCKRTLELLQSLASTTDDYSLLAAYVKASLCLGDLAGASAQIAKLKQMGYREERYLQYISTNPLLKGK